MTLASGAAFDPSIITITSSTRGLTVSTTDSTKAGVYSLLVRGTVTGFSDYDSALFDLTVTVNCSALVLTTAAIPDYSYLVSAATATIATLTWTESPTLCATITYVL